MKRSIAFITALLFAWLFIFIVPFHHHQATFDSSPHLDCGDCSSASYHSTQCQICLISANKTIKPVTVTFAYQPEISESTYIFSEEQPGYFNPVLKTNRAPPASI